MVRPGQDDARQDTALPTSLSTYSDASSSYWPPGWSFNRLVRATMEDHLALPDNERTKMQAGLRDVLGEDGVYEMARVVWQEQQRLQKLEEAQLPANEVTPSTEKPLRPPDWLKIWAKCCRGQPWGFIAFRTAAATAAIKTRFSTVEDFERRVREIVDIPFEAALEQGHSANDITEARGTFEIRWVEVKDEEPPQDGSKAEATRTLVQRLRAQYRTMRDSGDIPPHTSLPLFLCVSAEAVLSIPATLPSEDDDGGSMPSTTSPHWRPGAPFLLAVTAEDIQSPIDDDDEAGEQFHGGGSSGERSWFKPVFRVAAEVLIDPLWWTVERQITSIAKLTRFVREAPLLDAASTESGVGLGEAHVHGQHGSQGEGVDHNNDSLDAIWWSVHRPPHRMRERRRILLAGAE